MPLAQTYLLLSPEFGGTKFGPFKGMEIRLGSDSGRNDIQLPEALGVLPEHVKLLKQGDDTFIVAPTERSAGVFIWRAGHQRAKQITSPMAIQAGSDSYSADAFSLVTPEGPKFYIIQEIPQQDATGPETGLDRAKKRVSSKSLLAEIKRQGLTSVLTTRMGQQFQRWLTFIRTGAILHPRNIVTGALGLVGWVFAGGAACTMFSLASDRSVAQEELGECNSNMQMINMMNDNPTSADNITTIMARILNDQNWADAFESDDILFGAVKKKVKKILSSNRRGDYEWVYKKGNNFRKFRTGLQQQGMNQKLMAVVPYLAALPGNADTERDWNLNPKSADGQEECGRGPLNMTWRQAYNLGFTEEELQYDATVPENDYSDDRDVLTDLLRQSAESLGGIDSESIDFGDGEINNALAVDGVLCVLSLIHI